MAPARRDRRPTTPNSMTEVRPLARQDRVLAARGPDPAGKRRRRWCAVGAQPGGRRPGHSSAGGPGATRSLAPHCEPLHGRWHLVIDVKELIDAPATFAGLPAIGGAPASGVEPMPQRAALALAEADPACSPRRGRDGAQGQVPPRANERGVGYNAWSSAIHHQRPAADGRSGWGHAQLLIRGAARTHRGSRASPSRRRWPAGRRAGAAPWPTAGNICSIAAAFHPLEAASWPLTCGCRSPIQGTWGVAHECDAALASRCGERWHLRRAGCAGRRWPAHPNPQPRSGVRPLPMVVLSMEAWDDRAARALCAAVAPFGADAGPRRRHAHPAGARDARACL